MNGGSFDDTVRTVSINVDTWVSCVNGEKPRLPLQTKWSIKTGLRYASYLETGIPGHIMQIHQIAFVPPAPFIVAQAQGFFAGVGLEVKHTLTRSSIEQRDGLLERSFDLAITAMDNVMAWNSRGDDFRVVAQIERSTVLKLFGGPRCAGLATLKGGRILVDAVDSGFVIVLRNLLASAGLGAGDYSLVPTGGVKERLDGMLAGQGDATLLGPPLDAAAELAGLRLLAVVQQDYPNFPGQGVVVRRSRMDTLAPALHAYLDCLGRGLQWIDDHPAEAQRLFESSGFPPAAASAVVEGRALDLTPSVEGVNLLVDLRAKLGLLVDGPLAYADVVDTRFLPGSGTR